MIPQVDVPNVGSLVASIMCHQLELMKKYDTIEATNGFPVPHPPYAIDDRRVQHRIKELCWRATEEIAEGMEERRHMGRLRNNWREGSDGSLHHFLEELADALHFFIEASIVAGITPDEIESANYIWHERGRGQGTVSTLEAVCAKCADFVWSMGLACNCLKNKPWKLKPVITDAERFRRLWLETWGHFGAVFGLLGLTLEEIYSLYYAKNEVNKIRQQSGY